MERLHVLICAGTGCTSSRSLEIVKKLEEVLPAYHLENEVKIVKTGCFGLCQKGPIMAIYPDKIFYSHVTVDDVDEIVKEHFYKGRPVTRLELTDIDENTKEKIFDIDQIKFYSKQKRIALRNCGVINPEDIYEYIAKDGYQALGKALTEMTPQEVIDEILKSGLRGRGGGGFPTGRKWQFARNSESDEKYVICNADEGDPGAFMDRSILEGDPHAVLEAMAIAGYAIGAQTGYVYIRAEYPIAVERLKIAISQAKELGLLGNDIFGSGFNFDIEIRLGAGAFVCGEETALIASIEGKRGMPRTKPPRTVENGLFEQPTVLNNVETFANVPLIICNGSEWFKKIGTETSTGTKAFALTGNVNNTGLIEVPMGTTLREIIFDIGGGVRGGGEFKAGQIGGPSGGCLTEEHLDLPLDFDSLSKVGAIIGSGGLVVMDKKTCMVEVARFFMDFTQKESCGKCVPCREGTKRMLEILNRIVDGNGRDGDIELLKELGETISKTALCGLGKTAAGPVLSTIKYFEDEYKAHIYDKKCPAGACQKLKTITIDAELCKGCSKCARNCPVGAIKGEIKKPFVIEQDKCIKCGACLSNCPFHAIKEI